MPSRRRVLGLAAGITTSAVAGCLSRASLTGGSKTTPPPMEDGERERAEAPAIAVERDLALDGNQEYVEANETIRYPSRGADGETAAYGTIDVEEWMQLEAMSVGKRAVREHLDGELPDTKWLQVAATDRGGPETELDVFHITYEVPDGPDDVPSVSAAKLVTVTPRAVEVTVRFAGRSITRTYPVFVAKAVGRHLEDQTGTQPE